MRLVGLLVILIGLIACDFGEEPTALSGVTRSINGHYRLESIEANGSPVPLPEEARVTMLLDIGIGEGPAPLSGVGFCSDFRGIYEVPVATNPTEADSVLIVLEDAGAVQCPSPAHQMAESAFMEALRTVTKARVDLDQTPPRLVLTGPNTTMVFVELSEVAGIPLPASTTTTEGISA